MPSLARSLTYNVLGEASSLLLGFAASIVLARLLGPNGRGLLAVELSVANFVYALTNLGLPLSVQYHAGRRERPGSLLGATSLYGLALALVFVPAVALLRGPIADALSHGQGAGTWALAGVLVPLTFLQWTTANQLAGSLRFGLFSFLFGASRFVYVLSVLLLLGAAGLGVTAGLLANIVGSLVLIVGSAVPLLRLDRLRFDPGLFRRLVSYGVRLEAATVFQILNFRLDVLILQFFRPLADVGVYVVAQVIAELVTSLASAFQTAVLPLVSSSDEDGDRTRTTAAALRHQAILSAVAIGAIAVVGPPLVWFGFGPGFHRALVPMFVILPGLWFLNLGTVANASLSGAGQASLSGRLSGTALAVTIALDLALIPHFGMDGAAVASLVAYSTYGLRSLEALSARTGVSVRRLVLPTRSDLAGYPAAARTLRARVLTSRTA